MSSSSGNVSVPSAGIGVHHFHLWEFGEFCFYGERANTDWLKIIVRKKQKGHSRMDNPEIQATLRTRHRMNTGICKSKSTT
jgi:hypothetical protein